MLSAHTAFLIWNTLSILAAVIGVACAVRFAGLSIRGPVGAALLLVLSLSESLTTTLLLGNLNNCVLLALGSGYLLAERRGRPRLAGVLLGLSLAVKPVFVLVLLLPLLQRRWRTVGWAIAIPAVLNVAGFLLTPHRGDFLSIAVTNLLSARPGTNSSLWAMGVYWGVPGPTVAVLRVLIVLLALAGVWRLRSLPDRLCGLAVGYGLVLIATFLSFSLSEGYYSMLLAPLLVTAVRAGSPMRNPVAWVGVYFFLALNVWTAPQLPGLSARLATSRWTLGWLLLFAVLVVWALRRRPVDEPAHVPVLDTLSLDPPAGWESPVGR